MSVGIAGERPMRFPGLDGVRSVSVDGQDEGGGLAVASDGALLRFGTDSTRPWATRRVTGLPPIATTAQATGTSLALDRDGRVWDVRGAASRVAGLPSIRAIA